MNKKTTVLAINLTIIGIVLSIIFATSMTFEDLPHASSSELQGEVTIGLIIPLSGDPATHGEGNLKGAKLAVTDFNSYLKEN